jgi:hypothetical protein
VEVFVNQELIWWSEAPLSVEEQNRQRRTIDSGSWRSVRQGVEEIGLVRKVEVT